MAKTAMSSRCVERSSRAMLWLGAFSIACLATVAVHAGGTIGWADAVGEFAAEGTVVGSTAVTLAILAVGVVVAMALPSLLGYVIPLCLGGALMANADTVASIFGGGQGGGSFLDTAYAVAVPPTYKAVFLLLGIHL